MKHGLLLLLLSAFFLTGCRKSEDVEVCRMVKFVQENPLNKSFHVDNVTLKDGRMERLSSYDVNVNKDTLNRIIVFFEYNQQGKVKALRDESNPKAVKRFDADFDGKGNAVKITQTSNGNIEDEIMIEYDAQNRPTTVLSRYLLGINRSFEYDSNGNPSLVYRSDIGGSPSIIEHKYDDKRNFFSGLPAIQFYWIARPHNSFHPFGDNNIVSSKVYTYQGVGFKESENLQTRRELIYNEKGYPTMIRIMRNDLSSTVTNVSNFDYDCE